MDGRSVEKLIEDGRREREVVAIESEYIVSWKKLI